jgi:hypothetical protein
MGVWKCKLCSVKHWHQVVTIPFKFVGQPPKCGGCKFPCYFWFCRHWPHTCSNNLFVAMPFCSRIEGVPLWIKCMAQAWFFLVVHGGWWKGCVHFAVFCSLSFRNSAVFSLFKIIFRLLIHLLESKILLEFFLKCLWSPLMCISENKLSLFTIFVFTLDVQSPSFSWTVYNSYFKLMVICLAVAWHSVRYFWDQCSEYGGKSKYTF